MVTLSVRQMRMAIRRGSRKTLLMVVVLASLLWRYKSRTPAAQNFSDPEPVPEKHRFSLPPANFDNSVHESLENHPCSPLRPRNQFWHPPPTWLGSPAFLVLTITTNPDDLLRTLTYQSLAQSSLTEWRWLILDHGSNSSESQILLRQLARTDPRITVQFVALTEKRVAVMNRAVQACKDLEAPVAAFLEPYAMFEHTTMEKAAWAFASVPTWDIVSYFWAVPGPDGEVYTTGVHSGAANLVRDQLAHSSAFRVSAVLHSDCHFQYPYLSELWLCLASHHRWGGTIPEIGSWEPLTSTPGATTADTRVVSARWGHLENDSFDMELVQRSVPLEVVSWTPPFRTILPLQPGNSIMIIQGWLLVGGSELGFLEVLRHFATQGYRVTMVLTRLKYPEGLALRDAVARYTNDIHFLPAFLRMHDFPRYIKALVDSRGISAVIMSNSQLIYQILPALAEQTPNTKWIDYVRTFSMTQLHNEAYDGWKTHGFPSFALISQRHLSRTLTCSEHLRNWLIERGYPPERVGVAKLGVNISRFAFVEESQRAAAKALILGKAADPNKTLLLTSSARLDTQKRPLLVPEIIAEAIKRLPVSCPTNNMVMIMMGDGPLRDSLTEVIHGLHMENNVWLFGTMDEPSQILQGADLFLLPSAVEGISIAVAEAMAMGLPVVTSHAGGLPEQLGDLGDGMAVGGRLIPVHGTEKEDISEFADALVALGCNHAERARLGREARSYVQTTFDQDITLPTFLVQLEIAAASKPASSKDTPHPNVHYGLQGVVLEDFHEVDISAAQKQLAKIKLPGPGGQLEASCPGVPGAWVTAVTNGAFCDESKPQEQSWLFKAAKEQCGAWCLWDLRSNDPVGWQFNGKCFTPFGRNTMGYQICGDWFHHRPGITYIDASKPLFSL